MTGIRVAITRALKGERGASVAAVIILLSMMTVLGIVFTSLFSTGVEESAGAVSSTRALYTAEAGLEAAIGRLKKTPVSTNWAWNDGYLDKAAGNGTVDVEVLHYENRDGTSGSPLCETFVSSIETGGDNPARTIYITLAWDPAVTADDPGLGLELYNVIVADCNNPPGANLIAASTTTNNPETIRYRIADAAPADLPYTVRVLGNTAPNDYALRVSHPDDTETALTASQFTSSSMRSTINLGRVFNARREVFAGFSR